MESVHNTPRKIVFVTRGLHDVGGIERVTSFIVSLLQTSPKAKASCTIVALQKRGKPFFPLALGVRVVYLSDLTGRTRYSRLRNFYKELSPDLIILVGSNRSISLLPATRGYKTATWEHFNTSLYSHPLHGISRRMASRWCDAIITLTQEDREDYIKRYCPRRVVTLPNPITVDNLHPSKGERKVVLSVGRLVGQKGFDRLIDAWKIVAEQNSDWTLRIIGSGKWQLRLEKQIERLGLSHRIELLPHTSQIAQAYSEASIYVMSSRHEGFPLVLLEAERSALPLVSFDCPRGPRDLIENGVNGFLVPNGAIAPMAQALITLIENPTLRKDCAQASLQRSEAYLPYNILPQWIELIDSIVP